MGYFFFVLELRGDGWQRAGRLRERGYGDAVRRTPQAPSLVLSAAGEGTFAAPSSYSVCT